MFLHAIFILTVGNCALSLALLRRATVHKHMGHFQLATEDLRKALMEEPQNAAATVGDSGSEAC